MLPPSMSTFSLEECERLQRETSIKLDRIIKAETDTLNNIIDRYARGVFPDFLSLDVEGLEEVILQSIDYDHNFPKVICIETLTYAEDKTEVKERGVIDYLMAKGYLLYADTYINSILVQETIWKARKGL
jgi:hypothetical protein